MTRQILSDARGDAAGRSRLDVAQGAYDAIEFVAAGRRCNQLHAGVLQGGRGDAIGRDALVETGGHRGRAVAHRGGIFELLLYDVAIQVRDVTDCGRQWVHVSLSQSGLGDTRRVLRNRTVDRCRSDSLGQVSERLPHGGTLELTHGVVSLGGRVQSHAGHGQLHAATGELSGAAIVHQELGDRALSGGFRGVSRPSHVRVLSGQCLLYQLSLLLLQPRSHLVCRGVAPVEVRGIVYRTVR